MNEINQHTEWLSLMDVSGPFLAVPVLKITFQQGLDRLDPLKRQKLRQAYDEWREAFDLNDVQLPEIHKAWIDLVLGQGLELDEDGEGNILKCGNSLPESLSFQVPEFGIILRPDYAVVDDQNDDRPLLLIQNCGPNVDLEAAIKGDGWATSPAERMVQLCRATKTRLGLLTNGERWMLVDAPEGGITTFASWYAHLWGQEPITLQAFVALLGSHRFFVDESEQLPALLDNSLEHQDEVTESLGEQVRRAVEVLIQALDRADIDRNRELLQGVEPTELYEAGLTVMMRLVFLLCAEERGLLLLGDERYEENYAVSTLRMQLRGESEEILERRWDAWSRLLAIFRAVYGGVEHETLRMSALGGSLFDPDRFPFLEGRAKGTTWRLDDARTLPIDNRTVLLLLDAIQLFEGRTLSYRALDVEQVGYVYEGLLERTAARASEVTLDLDATKSAKKPRVTLGEIETAELDGKETAAKLLKERTGSSISRVHNDLQKAVDEAAADKLLTACHGDQSLRDRIKPYSHLLRTDRWGYPLVYPEGAFMVTTGTERRESGTHYTPKSLTEAIVKETLEPVVYIGPAEGNERKEWRLKAPAELLNLKICDPAMGSGAFLVQVCRYLSERLVEAWEYEEANGHAITVEGEVVESIGSLEPLIKDAEERLNTARRLIAERCLYGVDINPLAVELAKLSIWLITLAKGRPFGFLDHNLRFGDSLLGIQNLDQLLYLSMDTDTGQRQLSAQKIDGAVQHAIELRKELRNRPIRDINDVEVMANLDKQARQSLEMSELIADVLVGETLKAGGKSVDNTALSIEVVGAMDGRADTDASLKRFAREGLSTDIHTSKAMRKPFHWPMEFPEVFNREGGGFNAVLGNPPFIYGKNITKYLGAGYNSYLIKQTPNSNKNVDISAHFLSRAFDILAESGALGLICTSSISEGDTRKAGLLQVSKRGGEIFTAVSRMQWPGKANVLVSLVHIYKDKWNGLFHLNNIPEDKISSYLTPAEETWSLMPLETNKGLASKGVVPNGKGFFITNSEARTLLQQDKALDDVILPFMVGDDLNSTPDQTGDRFIINFWDWDLRDAQKYPEALRIVEKRVKPQRDSLGDNKKKLKEKWWLYEAAGKDMFIALGVDRFKKKGKAAKSKLRRAIAIARVSKTGAFAFVEPENVFAEITLFVSESAYLFAVLQSSIHMAFAWHQAGKMKNDLRYSSSLCFLPFPLPQKHSKTLEEIGEEFSRLRGEYLNKEQVGLTKFYKLFHNLDSKDPDVERIKCLQCLMDQEVLNLYGWTDIDLDFGFHEVSYLPKGKNVRFTISETAREELLYRLAMLNKERHEDEVRRGSLRIPEKAKSSGNQKMTLFDGKSEPVHIRSAAEQDRIEPVEQIYDWLASNEGKWFTKRVVLRGCGINASEWDKAIVGLLVDGFIEAEGDGDDVRYRTVI